MNQLSLTGISKSFSNVVALENVSFVFNNGIYGIVGPNGAGKSTMFSIITKLLKQDAGDISHNGKNITSNDPQYLSNIGFMPQNQQGYKDFRADQFLYYIASLKGIPKEEASTQIQEISKIVGLEGRLKKKIKTYSGGMRQRLMFIQALLGNPKILILDEPTAGLDPFERIKLRNYISEVSKNRIVIIATHVMQDIESIADEIIFLKQGSIVYSGTISQLLDNLKCKVKETLIKEVELKDYYRNFIVSRVTKVEDRLLIRYISDELDEGNCVGADLEDAFLYYLVDKYETD